MRTREKVQRGMWSYVADEDRIPKDHPLRAMRALIDPILRDLSPRFSRLYAKNGRASIPPEYLLRALLLQVLYSIRSERMLVDQLHYNMLFRWFVGLNTDDPVWHATTFTKNRDRLLKGDIATLFFDQVFELAREHDLVSSEHCDTRDPISEPATRTKAPEKRRSLRIRGADMEVGSEPLNYQRMKNIYSDALESFTFAEMFGALQDIGAETHRLEFKAEIAPKGLAHTVCSLANADGGLIVIGVHDPKVGEPLKFADDVDISDRRIRSYTSTVNAWVKPQPRHMIHAYADDSSKHAFLVVRVEASTVGPQEYLGEDETNLPVRSGTLTKRLSLGEIEALQRRPAGSPSESPLKQHFQRVTLNQQTAIGGDFFFGISATPQVYLPRRIMDPSDNQMCYEIEERTRGVDDRIHRPLVNRETLTDGVWINDGRDTGNSRIGPPPNQIEIDSDGSVIARFAQQGQNLLNEYYSILLTGYALAQVVFYRFGIAPRSHFHVIARLGGDAPKSGVAQYHEDRFDVDWREKHSADAFTTTMMLMFRTAGDARTRVDIHDMLDGAERFLPLARDLQQRWLAAS